MFVVGATIWIAVVLIGFLASRWSPFDRRLGHRGAGRLYWLGLAAAGFAAVGQAIVPSVPAEIEAGGFSVERAQVHIESIAARPHPIGSQANAEVRAYLANELAALGLEPVLQQSSAADWYEGSRATVPVVNVMARVSGTDSTGAVAVVAHFDTVPETPGANDNTSGVVVALETARSLVEGDPLRNDVILLFTDGEEPAPRYGATAFVQYHPWFDDVRFVVNLEAIGTGGPSWLTEVTGPQSWVVDHYAGAAPRPAAYSFLTETTRLIGGSNSDFATFRDAGVPGVEFVYARGSTVYHLPSDTPESVSERSLFSHGVNTVGLVRRMAAEDLTTTSGDDMIFFTVGHRHLLRYPAWWAIPTAVIAGAAVFEAARRRGSLGALASNVAAVVGRLVLAVFLGTVLWLLVASWRDTMGILESTVHLVGLGLLAAMIMVGRVPGRAGRAVAPEGVLIVFWLVGFVLSIIAPGMSYLFLFPPLAGALALPFEVDAGAGQPRLGPGVATVGAWFLLAMPAIDVFHQFAQPRPGNPGSEVLPIIAVPLLLMGLGAAFAATFCVSSAPDDELTLSAASRSREPAGGPDRAATYSSGRSSGSSSGPSAKSSGSAVRR